MSDTKEKELKEKADLLLRLHMTLKFVSESIGLEKMISFDAFNRALDACKFEEGE